MTRLWWTAVLFMIGSTCFALGALPWYAEAVGLEATAATFFIGSIFFTSAALLQFLDATPRDVLWVAALVQLAGTFWFNWSTGNALRHNLSAAVADERVWRPDALGSIAFLVASALAWRGTVKRSRDWWIGALNMGGSIAFGVSAVASFILPTSDDVWHAELANLGTFVGALGFLAGAVLLLPSRSAVGEVAVDHGHAD